MLKDVEYNTLDYDLHLRRKLCNWRGLLLLKPYLTVPLIFLPILSDFRGLPNHIKFFTFASLWSKIDYAADLQSATAFFWVARKMIPTFMRR